MTLDATYLMKNAMPYEQSRSEVRVGAFQRRSLVAGPGARAVIWVTGCNRRCPGCIKPEFLPFEAGTFYAVDYLENMVVNCPGIEGVTYSGGEPFEQATALGELSQRLNRRGLTILSYSGYRLEALQANAERFGPLLNQLDWLIDGEYLAYEDGPFVISVRRINDSIDDCPEENSRPRKPTDFRRCSCR